MMANAMTKKAPSQSANRNKAKALLKRKKFVSAIPVLVDILKNDPNDFDAAYEYAKCLRETHQLTDAIQFLMEYVKANPRADMLTLLGILFREVNDLPKARDMLERAIKVDPNSYRAWSEMSITYYMENKSEHAILLMHKAMQIKGAPIHSYTHFMSVIFKNFEITVFNADFKALLLQILKTKYLIHEYAMRPWGQMLMLDTDLFKNALSHFVMGASYAAFDHRLSEDSVQSAICDEYLLEGLKKGRVCFHVLENAFTHLRCYFLLRIVKKGQTVGDYLPFIYALADQCFFNEYVFYELDEEKETLRQLVEEIENADLENHLNIEDKLAILGCYKALFELKNAKDIQKFAKSQKKNKDLQELVRVQIDEYFEEQKIKKNLKSFSPIADEVSLKVQEQYEENPYPRWKDTLVKQDDAENFARVRFSSDGFEPLETLIAGCGTAQAAGLRMEHPEGRITAIDISKSSLAYAKRKCDEFRLKNIEFYHGDILDIPQMGRQFDTVHSTGVLHHMEDPIAGWKALTDVLKPGGFMFIALYSESARVNIVKAREFIEKNNYPGTPDGIRQCRQDIMAQPGSDLYKNTQTPDFFTLSSCRDLIFHVQEHRFTLNQIQEASQELGLNFLRMVFRTTKLIAAYSEMFPDDPDASSLENLKKFEAHYPRAFAGMYQFWLQKSEEPEAQKIGISF